MSDGRQLTGHYRIFEPPYKQKRNGSGTGTGGETDFAEYLSPVNFLDFPETVFNNLPQFFRYFYSVIFIHTGSPPSDIV